MPTLVMKFGGTSVGSPEAMAQSVQIVQKAAATWPKLVVVTSALSGITDLLLTTAGLAAASKTGSVHEAAGQIVERHEQILAALVPQAALRDPVLAEIKQLADHLDSLCQAWMPLPAWGNAWLCAFWPQPCKPLAVLPRP